MKQAKQVKHRDKNLSHLKNSQGKQNQPIFINFYFEVRKICVNQRSKLTFNREKMTKVKGLTISCSSHSPVLLDYFA
jgi:hypothetical protein